MDQLEQAGLAAAAANGSRTITLNTPITDNPQLEQIRLGLQRDYSAKTQEVADQRRQAEQLLQQGQMLAQQAQLVLQSRPQNAPPQAQNTPSLVEAFQQKFGTELDATSKQTLGFIAEYLGQPQSAVARELQDLKAKMDQIAQQSQQSQSLIRAVAVKPELDSLAAVFGEQEIQKRLPQVGQLMNANPGLSFKQALAAADPDFYAERFKQDALQKQQSQSQQDDARIRALIGDGTLEGVIPTPNGATTNEPQFKSGESMLESVRKVLGEGAFRTLVAQDALNRTV